MEEIVEHKSHVRQVVDEIEKIINQTMGRLGRLYREYDQEICSSHRRQYSREPLPKDLVESIVEQIADRLIELVQIFRSISTDTEKTKKLNINFKSILEDFTHDLNINRPHGYVGVMRTDGIYQDYSDIMSRKIERALNSMRGQLTVMMLKLIKVGRRDNVTSLIINGNLNSAEYLVLGEFIENNDQIVEVILENNKVNLSDQYFANFISIAMTSESLMHLMLGNDDNVLLLGGIAYESIGLPLCSSQNKHRLCVSINMEDGLYAFLREEGKIFSSYVDNNTIRSIGQKISNSEVKALNPMFEFSLEQKKEDTEQYDDENPDLLFSSDGEEAGNAILSQSDVVDSQAEVGIGTQFGAVFLCASRLLYRDFFHLNEIYDAWYALDYALLYNNYWCVSYFLFKDAAYNIIDGSDTTLHIAAQYSSAEILDLLLRIPSIRRIIDQRNSEGITSLELAILVKKPKSVEVLLCHGADTNIFKKDDLYSLAFKSEQVDIIKLFLQFNVKIPMRIKGEFLKILLLVDHPLKGVLHSRMEFFNAVQSGNLDYVRALLVENKSVVLWRDFDNHSALYVSCASLQFEMYGFLLSNGFSSDPSEAISYGSRDDQKSFKEAALKTFLNSDDVLVSYLCSKTIPRNLSDSVDLKAIYRRLISEPLIKPILEVAEYATPNLLVYLDFGSENIQLLSPVSSDTSMGTCDFKVSRIIVGAKKEQREFFGTTIHEFTHLACQIIWGNVCLPYLKTSIVESKAYNSIFEKIKARYNNAEDFDIVIRRVFLVDDDEENQKAELIVRVPHILARDGQDAGMKLLQQQVPELLVFYQDVVLVACRDFIQRRSQIEDNKSHAYIEIQQEFNRRAPRPSYWSNVSVRDAVNVTAKIVTYGFAAYGFYTFFKSHFGSDTQSEYPSLFRNPDVFPNKLDQ
ncbi:MAG: ankyrin repeat domain-containing protein [Gammaproteobacteria bacterium]|nr:ankyrin repeat domain-containing protein [Gammaproteobacteria bacterium]